MTHEQTPFAEADGGPQHTHDLPDATSIPVAPDPFDLEPWHQPDEWDSDDPPAGTVPDADPGEG